jgi:hypothetical protein
MLVVLQILEAMHASECELCRDAGTVREEGSVSGAQVSEPARASDISRGTPSTAAELDS